MPETKICAPILDWCSGAVTHVVYAYVHLGHLQLRRDNCMVYLVLERGFRCPLPLTCLSPTNSPWLQCGPGGNWKFLELQGKADGMLRVDREPVDLPWEMENIWRHQTGANFLL